LSSTNDTWRPLPSEGEPAPRAQSAFAFNGRELAAVWGLPDSQNAPLRDGAAYDPVARRWRTLEVPASRHRATAIGLSDGGLFVFGGARVDDDDDGRSWVMSPEGRWRSVSSAGAPAERRGKLARLGDVVVVWTGEEPGTTYDAKEDRWRALAAADAPTPSIDQECTSDGEHLVVWGIDDGGELIAGGTLYDPRQDQWTLIPAPPDDAEAMATGSPLLTTRHLFVTGCNRDERQLIMWIFDRARAQWSRGPTIEGLVESHHACAWTGTELLLLGGSGPSYETTRNVFAYAPDTDEWRAFPPIPWRKPRLEFAWAWTGRSLVVWSGMEDEQSMPGGFELLV
jgi:hypothetical protein